MRMRYVVLCLILFALPFSLSAQQPTSLAYGETVTGSITSTTPIQAYQFEGAAGDVITIVMAAADGSSLDSYLLLSDSSGAIVAENDDASDVTIDSAIENLTLPASDTYTIQATRFGLEGGISEGDFQLTLSLGGEGQPTTTETPAPTESATQTPAENEQIPANQISYNSPVRGFITLEIVEQRWTFEGSEGDAITIRMQRINPSASLDTYVILLDSDGNLLAENDDSPFGDDLSTSEILNFDLPYTGSYIIVATRYGGAEGTSIGEYSLEILTDAAGTAQPEATAEAPLETATPEPSTQGQISDEGQAIQYGAFVIGNFAVNAAPQYYDFEAQAGDIVTVSVKRQSGDFNPALTLRDSSGNLVAANNRFNGASDARLAAVAITSAGTYQIEVSAERGSSGEYVLHLFEANTTVSAATPEPESTEAAPTEEATPEPTEAMPDMSNAVLTITLSWNTTADFDLEVTDPNGAAIGFFSPESETGGIFGGDANGGCGETAENPNESVFWSEEPPSGTYEIGVAYIFPCDATDPVSFTLTVTLNGEVVETIEGELNQGQFQSYEWTLE